jgi:hypothetical protein
LWRHARNKVGGVGSESEVGGVGSESEVGGVESESEVGGVESESKNFGSPSAPRFIFGDFVVSTTSVSQFTIRCAQNPPWTTALTMITDYFTGHFHQIPAGSTDPRFLLLLLILIVVVLLLLFISHFWPQGVNLAYLA